MIKNKAVVNEDASGNVLQLQAEIRRLRERLEHYRSSSSSSITPSPVSTPMTPSCPFPHPSSLSSSLSMRSDDDKTIAELKEMLSASLLAREKTESENTVSDYLLRYPLIFNIIFYETWLLNAACMLTHIYVYVYIYIFFFFYILDASGATWQFREAL